MRRTTVQTISFRRTTRKQRGREGDFRIQGLRQKKAAWLDIAWDQGLHAAREECCFVASEGVSGPQTQTTTNFVVAFSMDLRQTAESTTQPVSDLAWMKSRQRSHARGTSKRRVEGQALYPQPRTPNLYFKGRPGTYEPGYQ